jgi:hypothetical protein
MPQWLCIAIGVAAGLAIVAAAIFLAVRPIVAARPPEPLFPASPDKREILPEWAGSNSWGGDHDHPAGADGLGY